MLRLAKAATFSILFLTATLVAGCAGEEYTPVDSTDIQPGPGLLSGEDGVFTIYGSQDSPEKESASPDTAEDQQ